MGKIENTKAFGQEIEFIENNSIKDLYSLNFMNSLKGKIQGVEIIQGTNTLGATSQIYISGTRSFNGNGRPIIILDDIPQMEGMGSIFNIDFGNQLNNISIDDIESIIVLKSGLGASIYGYPGGNGAIVINTKKASKPGFSVHYSLSGLVSKASVLPKFQNEYGEGYNGNFNYYNGDGDSGSSWGPKLDGRLISQFDGPSTGFVNGKVINVRGGDRWARDQAFENGYDNSITPTPWIPQPNNVKDFFETGVTIGNSVSIGWADAKGGVNLSYSNNITKGILPNNDLKRNTVNTNVNYSFFKRLKLFGGIYYSKLRESNAFYLNAYDVMDSPMGYFSRMGRQVNTESLKKYWQEGKEGELPFNTDYMLSSNNPYFLLNENSGVLNKTMLNTNYGAKINLFPGFNINYLGGLQLNSNDLNGYRKKDETIFQDKATLEKNELKSTVNNFYFDYTNSFAKLNFNLLGGRRYNRANHEKHYLQADIIDGEISQWGNKTLGFLKGKGKINEYYVSLNLSYNNFLFVNSTLSKSKIGIEEYIFSPLYSSLSVNLFLNKLIKLPDFISQLSMQGGIYKSNGGFRVISQRTGLPKYEFLPIKGHNISGKLSLFNENLSFTANYYKSKNRDVVNQNPQANISSTVENKGYELGAEAFAIHNNTIRLRMYINYFKNKNTVLQLPEFMNWPSKQLGTFSTIALNVGETSHEIYGTAYKRENEQIIYKDGRPVYGANASFGSTDPDYVIYFGSSLKYRKIELSVLFDYHKGGMVNSNFYRMALWAGNLEETLKGRDEGIIGDGVRWDDVSGSYVKNDVLVNGYEYFTDNSYIDEANVFDATYFKLQEVSISFPLNLYKLQLNCSVFGQNLFTWSSQKHFDPSVITQFDGEFYRSFENFNVPSQKVFGIKLQAAIWFEKDKS
ncbi:MAG: TonB-dependent receptor plug domain-containing protein [Salinivirgaceae bacterium]